MSKIYLFFIFSNAMPNRYSFRLARASKALETKATNVGVHDKQKKHDYKALFTLYRFRSILILFSILSGGKTKG
jgi:hypothetical protein